MSWRTWGHSGRRPAPLRLRSRVGLVVSVASALLTTACTAAPARPPAASASLPASISASASAAASCRLTGALAATCGPWWGASLESVAGGTLGSEVAAFETATGRRLDIVHTYHRWDDPAVSTAEYAVGADHHLLLVDWYPLTRAGMPVGWSAIAAGAQDGRIDILARQAAAYGRPLLVSFSHEPDVDTRHLGSLQDFAAAFAHVVERARADGARNVRWVWDVAGFVSGSNATLFWQLWPGDAVVDWVAWDPYNPYTCRARAWRSFTQTVRPFYDLMVAQGHGNHPFMLAEYGSVERDGDPGAKAAWFDSVPATLAALPRLQALVYFDHPHECDWKIDTSELAASAFSRLARSATFGPTSQVPLSG